MASSFMGLYVQRDALRLAQKGLDITGHNMSNIKTEGYSRQRLDVCSVANGGGTLGYNNSISLAGRGSEPIGVTQMRDELLDNKVRKYSSELCNTGAKVTTLADIEDILDDVENAETGLAAIMGKWKATFQSFSATGADRTDLANVCKNSAQSVLNTIKDFSNRIANVEKSVGKDIENTNTRINSILRDMANLNKQIESSYVQMNDISEINTDGTTIKENYKADVEYGPLELKDKFHALADELSQYINISVEEQIMGSFTVKMGDVTLVQKDTYAKTDIKFRSDLKDKVVDAGGNEVKAAFAAFDEFYGIDENGKFVKIGEFSSGSSGKLEEGTELLDKYGNGTGIFADGNGGFMDEDENPVEKVFILGENKYFDQNRQEITNLATVNDGTIVTDDKGNTITVRGNFDAESIPHSFVELYVSSLNTAKQWVQAKREVTDKLEKAGFGERVKELNTLIDSGDVEEAYRCEVKLMEDIAGKVDYDPIFRENIAAKAEKKGEKPYYPSYAISVSEESDKIAEGSVKGLFDMYNGEGECYSGVDGNSTMGVKYYAETIRSFAITMVREFNALYNDYNAKNPDDTFEMFEFDGASTVENIKISDKWDKNPIRCVHPEKDYNYDELDNEYINKILSAFERPHDFGSEPIDYTFEEFIKYYGDTMGSQLEGELNKFEATTSLYEGSSDAREEVMGVSMDEEGVNMMNYQKWYNAISRMITALDQCLEKLINETGVVGR